MISRVFVHLQHGAAQVLRLATTASLVVAAVACTSSSNDASVELAELARGCVVNSDCATGLVCAFGVCHDRCTTSRDCPNAELCVAGDRPNHVCQLPSEAACTTDAACPSGEICGVDDRCRDQCATAHDCVDGQLCSQGTCADTVVVRVDAGVDGSLGTACTYNSDCPRPLTCRDSSCAYECITAVDCAASQACESHACVFEFPSAGGSGDAGGSTRDGSDGACFYNSDCPDALVCRSGTCAFQCMGDRDCSGSAKCVSHVCQ